MNTSVNATLLPTLLAALLGVFSSISAHAQNAPASGQEPAKPSNDWQYSLGLGLISAPQSVGSSAQKTRLLPTFQIRYQDWFFIDPIRGVGVQSTLMEGLTGSVAVGVDLAERKAKDESRLTGLGDIDMAPALRLGLNYKAGSAFLNNQLTARLGDANGRGTLLDTDLGYTVLASRSAIVAVGVNLKGMDDSYARNFFGVSAAQAAASGLSTFQAQSGLQSSGLFVQAVLPLSGGWTFFGRAVQSRLNGDAAGSPITTKRDSTLLITTLNRSF